MSEDLDLALALADAADEITVRGFRSSGLLVEAKPDMTPVTEADRGVERALRDLLARERPDDAVLGEEFGDSRRPGARGWIIDPIDGTKSYVRGMPVWATLIALQGSSGEPEVAVVSAPALGRRWWAARGQGAFATDPLAAEARRLRVSAVAALEDAQLCFGGLKGWGGEAAAEPRPRVAREGLLALADRCWRTRAVGDFWSYMLVAEGAAELACEPEVSLWDLAAPQLIVEEAGGRFTDLAGRPGAGGGDALASNALLHEAALRFVGR